MNFEATRKALSSALSYLLYTPPKPPRAFPNSLNIYFKTALCQLDQKIKEHGLDAHIFLTIHDEVVPGPGSSKEASNYSLNSLTEW